VTKEFLAAEARSGSLKEYADAFEDIIAHFLEQKAGGGYLLSHRNNWIGCGAEQGLWEIDSTPDFLFLDEVIINGKSATGLMPRLSMVPTFRSMSRRRRIRYRGTLRK